MTKVELAGYRRRLLDLVRRLGGEVKDLWGEPPDVSDEEGGTADAPSDRADQGSHEYEEQVGHALAGNEERLLAEVTAALDRIEAGTFGRCGVCGRPIGHDRLRAVPYARFCIACARQEEQSSGP